MSKQWTQMGLGLAIAVVLAGCAHRNTRPVADSGVGAYIDGTVDPTISSIDRSLQTLVMLERGDEAPRKNGAIGDTVAGAAGKKIPAVAMDKSLPAGSSAAIDRRSDQMQYNRSALNSRVRLDWEGRADGLIAQVGDAIHYLPVYDAGVDRSRLPVIRVNKDSATVEEVLKDIAHQIDGKANIKVETATRIIRVTPAA